MVDRPALETVLSSEMHQRSESNLRLRSFHKICTQAALGDDWKRSGH
jgi:hypothetical protein